jgi:transcriptional regulator with XRE-family HTH domain
VASASDIDKRQYSRIENNKVQPSLSAVEKTEIIDELEAE